MKKLNIYLFYALALFPILDFAIINIITALFFVTIPFNLKSLSDDKNKSIKVYFILFLLALTLIPLFNPNFNCSIIYWLKKVFPLYITSVLFLCTIPYISKKEINIFKNIYIIGAIIYVLKFALIVTLEIYNGKLEIVSDKQFLFYSDIMNLLKPNIEVLDSYYHKPYFSLIILLALLFVSKKLIDERFTILNFSLIVFFLIAIVFPMSIPNIAITFIYSIYLTYLLYKKNKFIISGLITVCVTGSVYMVLYKSFEHKNLDLTEDIEYVQGLFQNNKEETKSNTNNPRKIIYSSLFNNLMEVPLLGYGYCEGKQTVTDIVEKNIYRNNQEVSNDNLLIDTDQLDSFLWKKNGVQVERKNNMYFVNSRPNNCQSHTLYQIINNLKHNEIYTFSVSIKSEQNNLIIRLGEINTQMVVFDIEEEDFSIHELARELHLSRSQMHRKIKALTGMSAAIYIRHIRLQKAKELLASTQLSISEIAYQVGFKTPLYFSQVFKETFGESPNSTRK